MIHSSRPPCEHDSRSDIRVDSHCNEAGSADADDRRGESQRWCRDPSEHACHPDTVTRCFCAVRQPAPAHHGVCLACTWPASLGRWPRQPVPAAALPRQPRVDCTHSTSASPSPLWFMILHDGRSWPCSNVHRRRRPTQEQAPRSLRHALPIPESTGPSVAAMRAVSTTTSIPENGR